MLSYVIFFFFNDTATTEIYTLSLHDALPISASRKPRRCCCAALPSASGNYRQPTLSWPGASAVSGRSIATGDRKSTRLNSQSRQYLVCRLLLEKKQNIILVDLSDNTRVAATW